MMVMTQESKSKGQDEKMTRSIIEVDKDEQLRQLEKENIELGKRVMLLIERLNEAANNALHGHESQLQKMVENLIEEKKTLVKTVNLLSKEIVEALQDEEKEDGE